MPRSSRIGSSRPKQTRKLATHDSARAEYMPIRDVTAEFGLSKTRVWELIAREKIQGRKLGRLVMVEVKSVRDFMASLPRAR